MKYVDAAIFVHSQEAASLVEDVQNFSDDIQVISCEIETFLDSPSNHLKNQHIVVSASMGQVRQVLNIAVEKSLSAGVITLPGQSQLIQYFKLPKKRKDQIELAFQADTVALDLVQCNDIPVFYKAVIGDMPIIDGVEKEADFKFYLKSIMTRFKTVNLEGFKFKTASERTVDTVATGCMIVPHHSGNLASRLIAHDSSEVDGMVSIVITSPLSVMAYLKFLLTVLKNNVLQRLPKTIGYIRSKEISIETDSQLKVLIDSSQETSTPANCSVRPQALKLNSGINLEEADVSTTVERKEKLDIKNLPMGDELVKAKKQKIPFFTYAAEERFKDLFVALRHDARLDSIFVTLMLVSTTLATLGLFQNSASVVIGAMLLAPLMAPIVSFAMGVLRFERDLYYQSLKKIGVGILLALFASALITQLFPAKLITAEMAGRLNPNLLDLGIAIFSGIAGAYTKSHKEILQSLAGVAIAVALVPPLAVAGIGLGRGDIEFFIQPFLLFATNLVGIIVASTLTFRVLGFSPAIRNKKSLVYVMALLVSLSVPLYLSFDDIVEKLRYDNTWQKKRFLVNGKYIIIKKAEYYEHKDKGIINMTIQAREPLSRSDMNSLKQKVKANYNKDLIIRASVFYII